MVQFSGIYLLNRGFYMFEELIIVLNNKFGIIYYNYTKWCFLPIYTKKDNFTQVPLVKW